MKIFSKAIATGREWKPCIECGRTFEHGEIISSISTQNGAHVTYWFCHLCIARYFIAPENLYIDLEYMFCRADRLIEMKKFNNKRYAPYSNIKHCSLN